MEAIPKTENFLMDVFDEDDRVDLRFDEESPIDTANLGSSPLYITSKRLQPVPLPHPLRRRRRIPPLPPSPPSPPPSRTHGYQLVLVLRNQNRKSSPFLLPSQRFSPRGFRQEGEFPYCGRECQALDDPDSIPQPHHTFQGTDDDGIRAWASQIPPDAECEPCDQDEDDSFSIRSSSSGFLEPQPPRTPKLLLPHQKPLPPTLCTSALKPSCSQSPSLPIHTPQRPISRLLRERVLSESCKTSSILTDSISTPQTKPSSFFSQIASHVRSWVATPPQPAIVGVDQHFASRSCLYLEEDDIVDSMIKLDWNLANEKNPSPIRSNVEEGDYLPLGRHSPTPTPRPTISCSFSCTSDTDSSSVLETLVEELHPAFKSRGRKAVRYVS